MSPENVEIVRRGLEAFNRGDLDEALDTYDPDVELKTLLSGSVHGREQVRATIEQLETEMGPVHYLLEELVDAGDTVVGVVRAAGVQARLSGIRAADFASSQQIAFAWTLRDGLIVRGEIFGSRSEAFEAAGLSA